MTITSNPQRRRSFKDNCDTSMPTDRRRTRCANQLRHMRVSTKAEAGTGPRPAANKYAAHETERSTALRRLPSTHVMKLECGFKEHHTYSLSIVLRGRGKQILTSMDVTITNNLTKQHDDKCFIVSTQCLHTKKLPQPRQHQQQRRQVTTA